jgi:hypothetical protein
VKALKTEVVVKDLDQLAAHLCLSPTIIEVDPA